MEGWVLCGGVRRVVLWTYVLCGLGGMLRRMTRGCGKGGYGGATSRCGSSLESIQENLRGRSVYLVGLGRVVGATVLWLMRRPDRVEFRIVDMLCSGADALAN